MGLRAVERVNSVLIDEDSFDDPDDFSTQVLVGVDHGLKHDRWFHCDELISFSKRLLTNFVGSLSPNKIEERNKALSIALDIRGSKGERVAELDGCENSPRRDFSTGSFAGALMLLLNSGQERFHG